MKVLCMFFSMLFCTTTFAMQNIVVCGETDEVLNAKIATNSTGKSVTVSSPSVALSESNAGTYGGYHIRKQNICVTLTVR